MTLARLDLLRVGPWVGEGDCTVSKPTGSVGWEDDRLRFEDE